MSASMLYHAQGVPIRTFNQQTCGLIFRPGAAKLSCGCAQDCGAGCGNACDPERDCFDQADAYCSGCSWMPGPLFSDQFVRASRQEEPKYNEMVMDADFWAKHMPDAIEAVTCNQQVLSAFLQTYQLPAVDYPLLSFNLYDLERPFTHANA